MVLLCAGSGSLDSKYDQSYPMRSYTAFESLMKAFCFQEIVSFGTQASMS